MPLKTAFSACLAAFPWLVLAGVVTVSWEPPTEAEDGTSLAGVPLTYEIEFMDENSGEWKTFQSGLTGDSYGPAVTPSGCYTLRMYAVRMDANIRSAPSEEVYKCIEEVYQAAPGEPGSITTEVHACVPQNLDPAPPDGETRAERRLRLWKERRERWKRAFNTK